MLTLLYRFVAKYFKVIILPSKSDDVSTYIINSVRVAINKKSTRKHPLAEIILFLPFIFLYFLTIAEIIKSLTK